MRPFKNIFREYNIPIENPKTKRKRVSGQKNNKLSVSRRSNEKNTIRQQNNDLDINTNNKQLGNSLPARYSDSSDAEDSMPLPIKEEPVSQQQSEEFHLSLPCSSVSTDSSSIPPRLRSKISSDESSIYSDDEIGDSTSTKMVVKRKNLSKSLGSNRRSQPKRLKKELMKRYKPLNITITNHKTMPATSKNDLNSSWTLSDGESFQNDLDSQSVVCSSPKPSQVISTPSTSTPSPRKRPTELDLMIELIAKENAKDTTVRRSPRKSKRCLAGGYVEMYERALTKAKTDSKFLRHDKKFGIRNGIILQILKVDSMHGITVAQVQKDDCTDGQTFYVVLPANINMLVKSDSRIEAFFDYEANPYKINGKSCDDMDLLWIQPYKLLLL